MSLITPENYSILCSQIKKTTVFGGKVIDGCDVSWYRHYDSVKQHQSYLPLNVAIKKNNIDAIPI